MATPSRGPCRAAWLLGLVTWSHWSTLGGMSLSLVPKSGGSITSAGILPRTWSNPDGRVLTPFREGLWAAERPFLPRLPGLTDVDVGGKMAVVKLEDGSLWVHSPVELDAKTQAAMDCLGPVRHIVTPNTEHQKYAPEWIKAYPSATSYACPGLRARKPDVGWTQTIGATEGEAPAWNPQVPASWEGQIEACWIDTEEGPLMGRPFFSEVVFLHRASKTLLVSDFWWNYPGDPSVPWKSRAWKLAMDRIYAPFYNQFMQVKPEFKDRLDVILGWDFDAILPCHGSPITKNAKDILARHLGY